MFTRELRVSVRLLAWMTLVTGIAYPLVVTGIARATLPGRANGSLVVLQGRTIGSELLGQPFDDPKYFWGRLSGTTPPYDARASAATNYGPLNPALARAAQARIDALRRTDPQNHEPVPVDLVTASASGLDPHISPAAAAFQVRRVAAARGLDPARVRALVERFTEGRTFGVLGQPRVNVLLLNASFDQER